jgi:multicomponent Na+:H+ antiporter subunit A
MLLGPVVLSLGGLVIGLFPDSLARPLISAATNAVRAEQVPIKLALWHGVNLVLVLSIVTFLGGIFLYLGRQRIKGILNRIPANLRGDSVYTGSIAWLNRLASAQTRIIQSGYLRHYVLIVVLTTLVLVGGTFIYKAGMNLIVTNLQITVYEILVVVSIMIGVAISILASSRLTAVVGLSVVGFGITIIFILFAAPDLAITQFAVETLTVILLILVIYRLPRFLDLSSASVKFRDSLIAISLGGLISVLLLSIASVPMDSELKEYFAQNSLALGKGLNVVNVILVDFRAIDTLGECIVLVLAAFGIYALLKVRTEK